MEKIRAVKIDKGIIKTGTAKRKAIMETVSPTPDYRTSYPTYMDRRCIIGFLNSDLLLEKISKDISKYENIKYCIQKNPELKSLLNTYGLNIKNCDFVNFPTKTDEHMKQTALIAGKICDNLGINTIRKAKVIKAARLHDIGKIFIPSGILNKKGRLTGEEKSVMDVHAKLGHKLLETLNIDNETLDLIKNHHSYNGNSSIEQQIVSASDIFSALTENSRTYRNAASAEDAIKEISSPKYGFSKEVIEALKKSI